MLFCRYELQYAVAGRGGGNDTAVWEALEGNSKDTWVVTVQVDGFDRYRAADAASGDLDILNLRRTASRRLVYCCIRC